MKKKIPKTEAREKIEDFFKGKRGKNPEEVRRIKKIAMNNKISLKDKRKLFCRHCLMPYSGKEKIRIKKGIKNIECANCKKIARWKIR